MTKRKRDSEATRTALLDAAQDVFLEHGYAGASVRRVAERAGVTHGTLYLYFRDKDDLLYQLSEELFRQLLARLRTLPRTLEPVARLREALHMILHFGLEFPGHYHIMMSMRPPHRNASSRQFGPLAEEVLGYLFDAVQRAAERGNWQVDDLQVTSHALVATVHGVIDLNRDALLDPDAARQVGEHAIHELLAGLSARPRATLQATDARESML
jgi:AcrR family transcriptional regulator